jgi:cobalamin biosynthesis protein CbiG
MVQVVAQVAARVLRLLSKDKKPEEAQQVLAEGYRTLSLDREFLLVLDGPSIRTHCGNDEEKLALAARLLLSDCEVQLHKADRREAQRTLRAARRTLAELSEKPAELSADLERLTQASASL